MANKSGVDEGEWLHILLAAAYSAREAVLLALREKGAGKSLGVGAGGDVTLKVDVVAEKAVADRIRAEGAACTIIFEEAGEVSVGAGGWYVAADALDGTRNALRGAGPFATSLAASPTPRLSDVRVGVVVEHASGTAFYAVKGEGAKRDGVQLKAKGAKNLREAIIGVDLCGIRGQALAAMLPFLSRVSHMRHIGSNALELCYVASGAIDMHVDLRGRIRPTDVAAGMLIVEEAGGVVVDSDGKKVDSPIDPSARLRIIASSNRGLVEEAITALKGSSLGRAKGH